LWIYKFSICGFLKGLIALLDLYLFKSCGYGPLTNLNTKHPYVLILWQFWTPTSLLT